MFTRYTSTAKVHLACVMLFQNTGEFYFLYPSLALLAYGFVMWCIAVGFFLSPLTEIEIGEEEFEIQSDFHGRLALQICIMIVCYILYLQDYLLIAGALGAQSITVALSALFSMYIAWNADDEVEKEDDE